MMMFATLFGLSMDHEVCLLSRVREHYLRTRDNSTAVGDEVFLKTIGLGLVVGV